MNDFYVYEHLRADTGEVFYIGKGKGVRASWKYGRNERWCRSVKKYGGYSVRIAFDGLSEKEALKIECWHIASHKMHGTNLANLTDGGEGVSGYVASQEAREKLRAANSGEKCFWYGKKFSDSHIENMRKGHPGNKHPAHDKTLRKWIHSDGSVATSTTLDMRRRYNDKSANWSRVASGRSKSVRGWRLA